MKKLLNLAIGFLACLIFACIFAFLLLLAATDDLTPPAAAAAEQTQNDEGQFDFDHLRDLCRVPWPASIAGDRTEEARRRACRAVGE
jgi:hypothetical protein